MLSALVLAIPTLVLPLVIGPSTDYQQERFGYPAEDARALASFERAVEDYIALHRRLELAWPPQAFFTDPEQAEMAAEALRRALRDARPQAAQGDFFTPDVADVFRFRIADALGDDDFDPRLIGWPPEDDYDIDRWRPVINQPIPWGVSGVRWPALAMLPPLPTELAYRFVGRDLVLVDVHANLVVDILDLALPTVASTGFAVEPFLPALEGFEGCWPEELPAPLDRRDPHERHRLDEEE
jgi:hypothetical protein